MAVTLVAYWLMSSSSDLDIVVCSIILVELSDEVSVVRETEVDSSRTDVPGGVIIVVLCVIVMLDWVI